MNIQYTLTQIKPKVFLLNFESAYDAAMCFLRYQEYYESPNPEFRGKLFKILDFMKWYSEFYGGGVFTYPRDFTGFNIPNSILSEVKKKSSQLTLDDFDYNHYDHFMMHIDQDIKQLSNSDNYYLIGSSKNNQAIINHELAHAYFYLNNDYKDAMTKLVETLPDTIKNSIFAELKLMMYDESVYIDECQAYLSTCTTKFFKTKISKDYLTKFKKTFKQYNSK